MTTAAPTDGARLRALVRQLHQKNTQLEQALESRIVIEQAKGMLAERYGVTVEEAFELIRYAARSNRVRVHALAARVVTERATPFEIGLERASALR